jgi:hypothetical protein
MQAGDKIIPVQPTNHAAQWDVEDDIMSLGKVYVVEQEKVSNLLFVRNNEGHLTSVDNFVWKSA